MRSVMLEFEHVGMTFYREKGATDLLCKGAHTVTTKSRVSITPAGLSVSTVYGSQTVLIVTEH